MSDIVFLDEVEAELVDRDAPAPHGLPCPACGCPVEADDQFCPACGTRATPETSPAPEPAELHKHFECDTCGARVSADLDQRSIICPFCDSTYVRELPAELTGRQPPEFVIGFAVTPEQAQQEFRAWFADNAWFRPADLQSAKIEQKLRGVYLPFWSFTMLASSRWSASIGEYWYRTETYTTTDSKGKTVTRTRTVRETEWWPLEGRYHQYHRGYMVSGSRGLPQQDADRIKPFQLPALKRYRPDYLAGWLCEEYSVDRDDALQTAQEVFYRREKDDVARFLPGNTHRSLRVTTSFDHVHSDLCLLPVYLLSYRYRDKLYRFLINGQTGKTAGNKPVSWRRILAGVFGAIGLVAALVVAWLLFLGLIAH